MTYCNYDIIHMFLVCIIETGIRSFHTQWNLVIFAIAIHFTSIDRIVGISYQLEHLVLRLLCFKYIFNLHKKLVRVTRITITCIFFQEYIGTEVYVFNKVQMEF